MTWRAWLACALGCIVVVAAAGGASAADAAAEASGTGMVSEIIELDGIADDADGVAVTARIANRGPDPVADVRVRLTLHDRTRSRYALAEALDAGAVGGQRRSAESARQELGAGEERRLVMRVPPEDLGLAGAAPGVYPAMIAVLDEYGTAAEHVTAVIVPPERGEPLRLATLLELRGPVATGESGPHDASAIATSAERAERLAEALRRPLPATVAVDGRMVTELRAVAGGDLAPPESPEVVDAAEGGLDAIASVDDRADTETVTLPYGPADLVALIRAGMRGEARHLVDLGKAAAEDVAGSGAARTGVVTPPRGLDAPTAEWLTNVASATVLTEAELGLPLDRDLPSTPPAVRTLSGVEGLRVAVPDPLIADALARTDPGSSPAMTAQRVLAETAAAFFERPGASTPRGIVLAPPLDTHPELLPTIAEQLESATWLEAVPLSRLLEAVRPSGEPESLAYDAEQQEAELPEGYLRRIREARRRLEPLAEALGAEAVAEHAQRLDAASAVAFRERPLRARGRAIVASITDLAAEIRRAVTVVEGPPLTLTGTEGAVPVTLASTAESELTVRVRLLTTRYRVEDAQGRDVVLPPEGEVTTTFDVEALAPGGTYPLTVEVASPDGEMGLAGGRVIVRSTAFSVTGAAITGGAALLLVGWVVHALARRRARPDPADGGPSKPSAHETAAPGGAR